ncbi:MAG TPA: hypothetical protein VEJ87_11150 [Acidimicrobiales bacterium]|nr:hypothetical protein [Acidimicrobiales bacterium]
MAESVGETATSHRRGLHPHRLAVNRYLALLVGLVAAGLVPWTVFLALTLPKRYDVHDWTLLWTGFDVLLCLVLAEFARSAWMRRQVAVATAIVAGTLLVCDAWFDFVTSWGNPDHWVSIVTAVFGELPLAAFMFWIAYRVMTRAVAAFHALSGAEGMPPSIFHAPLMTGVVDPRGSAAASGDRTPIQTLPIAVPESSAVTIMSDLHSALESIGSSGDGSSSDKGDITKARQAVERALTEVQQACRFSGSAAT